MKLLKIIILLIIFTPDSVNSQQLKGVRYSLTVIDGDTIPVFTLPNVLVYSKKQRSRISEKKYERLARAVKLTYPIALEASRTLKNMEAHLSTLHSEKEQQIYAKAVEDSIKNEYMPIIKEMSMYQGIVLLKLIDRQTGKTSYKLVQEIRGKLSAFFWQGITRMFGGNLKVEYDKYGDDIIIEQLISLYEAGLL